MKRTSPLEYFEGTTTESYGIYTPRICNDICPCRDIAEIKEQLFAEFMGWA